MSATTPSTPATHDAAQQPQVDDELPPGINIIKNKGGSISYQGDFRQYADVGGKRVILREPGEKWGVACAKRAVALYEKMREALEETRKSIGYTALEYDPRLGPVALAHLRAQKEADSHASSTVAAEANILMHLVLTLDNPRLSEVTGPRLESYIKKRKTEPGVRAGTTVSPRTILNELSVLSGVYSRAQKWKLIGHNPVKDVTTKPRGRNGAVVTWLSPAEAGRLLDAAARIDAETRRAKSVVEAYRAARARGETVAPPTNEVFAAARRFAHCEALIATFLYSGGRLMEVLGLDVADLDFEGKRVHFRPNAHRTLKKAHHKRKVVFWRPLRDVLLHFLAATGRADATSGLLFAGINGQMMRSFTKSFARCVAEAGLEEPERFITRHTLRHTYATMLLATVVRTEGGRWAERSSLSVSRALGHRTSYLVEITYGHDTDGIRRMRRLSYERYREIKAARLRTVPDSARPISEPYMTRHFELVA